VQGNSKRKLLPAQHKSISRDILELDNDKEEQEKRENTKKWIDTKVVKGKKSKGGKCEEREGRVSKDVERERRYT
jgi:hypothetical protein